MVTPNADEVQLLRGRIRVALNGKAIRQTRQATLFGPTSIKIPEFSIGQKKKPGLLASLDPCYFFDCDTSDPASAFVVAAEPPFCKTAEAFASIGLLVVLFVPACASALPAKLF